MYSQDDVKKQEMQFKEALNNKGIISENLFLNAIRSKANTLFECAREAVNKKAIKPTLNLMNELLYIIADDTYPFSVQHVASEMFNTFLKNSVQLQKKVYSDEKCLSKFSWRFVRKRISFFGKYIPRDLQEDIAKDMDCFRKVGVLQMDKDIQLNKVKDLYKEIVEGGSITSYRELLYTAHSMKNSLTNSILGNLYNTFSLQDLESVFELDDSEEGKQKLFNTYKELLLTAYESEPFDIDAFDILYDGCGDKTLATI